jgi:hypothetical protein
VDQGAKRRIHQTTAKGSMYRRAALDDLKIVFSLSASYFLLLGQKKVTKEKATLLAAPSEYPALLAKPSGCATRATRSDSARRLPSAWLRYSAAHKGTRDVVICDVAKILT